MIAAAMRDASGQLVPTHQVGTDDAGRPLYLLPAGCEPVGPYELNEDGLWTPVAQDARE